MYKKLLLLIIFFILSCELFDNEYYKTFRDPLTNYEIFWRDLNDYYGLIDFKNLKHLNSNFGGWDELYKDHKKYISSDMSERELFAVLSSVLYNLHDAHSYWMKNRAPESYFTLPEARDYPHPANIPWASEGVNTLASDSYGFNAYYSDLRIPRSYLVNSKYYEDDILYAGFIDLNKAEDLSPLGIGVLDKSKRYGYISISTFIKYNDLKNFNAAQNWSKKIDIVLEDLTETDGIILDLRHNSGGYEGNLEVILRRFIKERKMVYVSFTRNGSYKNSFDRVEYYIDPNYKTYNNPVILLTDRATSSSGDLFALGLKGEDGVFLLGQNTHGILSKVITRELPIGWTYRMSSGFTLDVNGVNYEEVGVPPDITISKTDVFNLYTSYNSPTEQHYFYDPIFIKAVEALDLRVSKDRDLLFIKGELE